MKNEMLSSVSCVALILEGVGVHMHVFVQTGFGSQADIMEAEKAMQFVLSI